MNIRYIGGGARSTEEDDPGREDGYANNWLYKVGVSLGVTSSKQFAAGKWSVGWSSVILLRC
jgi:hypothetical protein